MLGSSHRTPTYSGQPDLATGRLHRVLLIPIHDESVSCLKQCHQIREMQGTLTWRN
jgi:hypothetical protein